MMFVHFGFLTWILSLSNTEIPFCFYFWNVLQTFDQTAIYESSTLSAPVLRGNIFRFFVNVVETRFFGRALLSKFISDSRIPLVRRFALTRTESPTFLPLVSPTESINSICS
jgi:hypothetical protein